MQVIEFSNETDIKEIRKERILEDISEKKLQIEILTIEINALVANLGEIK